MTRFLACLLTLLFSLSSPAMEGNADFWRSPLAAKKPALPDSYWINKKAPTQVDPGTRRITDMKPSGRSQGEVYERTSHYDQFGRQTGQTHKTAHGEPAVHPNPHHHTRNPVTGEVSDPLPGVHPDY